MDKLKGVQSLAISVAVLVVAFAVSSYAGSYASSIQPTSFRSFSVSADGKVVAVPDVAKFTFSVLTEGGKSLADLQASNTKKVNAAIDFVKSKSVDAKDIKTQQYSVDPRYQYYSCPHPESSVTPCPPADIVGYTVTQSVAVNVRDFNTIGDILAGVVTKGANSVSSLQFTVDDPTAPQNQAREEAIKKAQDKASAIAKAGGFSLGRLLSIDEGTTPQPYYPVYAMADSKAMGIGGGAVATPAPSVEPGSQDVNVTVTLRYEIK